MILRAVMYLCVFVDIYIESQKGAESALCLSLYTYNLSLVCCDSGVVRVDSPCVCDSRASHE